MGLPGSGKTTLAADLQCILSRDYKSYWLNADVVRIGTLASQGGIVRRNE